MEATIVSLSLPRRTIDGRKIPHELPEPDTCVFRYFICVYAIALVSLSNTK